MNPTGILEEVNNLIIEANFELDDDEVLRKLGSDGYPSQEEVSIIQSDLRLIVDENRKQRLLYYQQLYSESMVAEQATSYAISSRKSVDQMIKDIVSVISGNDNVPEGLLIAFREQNKKSEVDEKDIKEIWEDLVKLGLIQNDSSDNE